MNKYKLIFSDKSNQGKQIEKVISAYTLNDAYTEGKEEQGRSREDFWGDKQLRFERAEAVEEPKPEPKQP